MIGGCRRPVNQTPHPRPPLAPSGARWEMRPPPPPPPQARDRPRRVKLDDGLEPKGLLAGIPGMKAGGKRKLYLPAELGYGDKGKGQIPANAKLIYEVEVLRIVPPGEPELRPFDD